MQSIKPITAAITMEERMALGVYLNSGVMNYRVSSTTIDKIILDAAVLQPAMLFTADRPKPPTMNNFCHKKLYLYIHVIYDLF